MEENETKAISGCDFTLVHPAEQTRSEWTCYCFGQKNGISLHPMKGDVPNWFWRWMQYLCFGNRWVRNK